MNSNYTFESIRYNGVQIEMTQIKTYKTQHIQVRKTQYWTRLWTRNFTWKRFAFSSFHNDVYE